MKRFIGLFIVVILIAFGLVYSPPVRTHVIGPFTESLTHFSSWIIQLFGGNAVVESGNILRIPATEDRVGTAVRIIDMCNGVEATLLLWAAMLAFPAPLGYKLKGLLIGTLTVHFLNIIRIISLTYLRIYKPEWFHWAHWYLWDTLIMLDILVVFLAWIRLMPAREQDGFRAAAVA